MHPIPCSHCGNNFMRRNLDPDAPKLCNNCEVREEKRNPKKEDKMTAHVNILIKCPIPEHREIEEHCINEGIDMTKYFMELHYGMKSCKEEIMKVSNHPRPVLMGKLEEVEDNELPSKAKPKGKK